MDAATDSPNPHQTPNKLLVCVDQSEAARRALGFACRRVQKHGGTIDLLHVIPPAGFASLFSVADHIEAESRDEAEALMKRLSDEAMKLTGVPPALSIKEGDTGQEILKAATEDPSITLLVFGVAPGQSKGRLVGWLSSQLGEQLTLPVLLVPGNLTDQQLDALT